MTDFLDDKRREINKRLAELKPLAEEYHLLESAAKALRKIPAAPKEASATASRATRGRRKRGRPRGSVNRGSKAAAAATPASAPAASTPATEERKKPGRPKGSRKKIGRPPGSGKKVGRPTSKVGRPKGRRGGRLKGGGKRATEALSLVQAQPGITIPELASKMGIKQNYLYRVLPGLEQDGKLEKKGRGWYPKGGKRQ